MNTFMYRKRHVKSQVYARCVSVEAEQSTSGNVGNRFNADVLNAVFK